MTGVGLALEKRGVFQEFDIVKKINRCIELEERAWLRVGASADLIETCYA